MTATGEAARTVAVVGPTATGKSTLAEQLALRLGGEVVSADSMQVYRRMDIGTAKVLIGKRQVAHHLIDIADPGEPFSAALYQDLARATIDRLLEQGLVPVVCGGTGLYVRAALDVMEFPSGEQNSPTRERLERLADELGPTGLHALLRERDPASAAIIHEGNVRRTIRALEMAQHGVSYAEQARRFAQRRPYYESLYIGLSMDRELLYARIDARVDEMVDAGLVDEVSALLEAGLRDALTSAQAIGYKEIVDVIDGRVHLDEAIERVKRASRRYAKRQLTWFRSDPRIKWVDVTGLSSSEVANAAFGLVESHAPHLVR